MMKTLIATCLITLIFSIFIDAAAISAADYPYIEPFDVISDDGTVIFRFNPNHNPALPATGLYHNTYPYEMIFTVEHPRGWHVYRGSFFFTPAMRHFAVVFPYPTDYAIEFFAHGVRSEGYRVHELVQDHEYLFDEYLPGIGQFYMWWDTLEHERQEARLIITTYDQVRFVFEIVSGQISYMTGARSGLLLLVFGAVMLFFFMGARHMAKRKVESHQNRGFYG